MPSRSVTDRLNAGEVLLMDGGIGSELHRRGVNVLKDATESKGLETWTAQANVDAGDVVTQIHQDYLRVGADVIISNNFWTSPTVLRRSGLEDRWEEFATAAARNAVTARDNMAPEAYVAGGMAPPNLQRRFGVEEADYLVSPLPKGNNPPDVEIMGRDSFHKEFADQARIIAGEGADVMLPEYMGRIADCVESVDACAETGKPVWLGVRHVANDGSMHYGESLADLAEALEGHPVDAILIMCSNPPATTAALRVLRDAFDGVIGAYPNIGYNPTGPLRDNPLLTNQEEAKGQDILQTESYPPSRMAEFALEWKEMGARIIGGCCASGPEHIMAMRPVVKGA